MNENKTSKYFKYAIGEIILVVIGILIALQINNWNEASKEKSKEVTYLKNLDRDLNDQLKSIDEQISNEKGFVDTSIDVMKSFKINKFVNVDTLFFNKLTELQSRKTFVITDPTYTDLLSSGNIDIIKNKKFKDQLIQYYQELELVEKIIQNNNFLLVDQQYASVYLDVGYYYNQEQIYASNYMTKNTSKITLAFEKELAEISKKLIKEPKNKLQLMNVSSLRHTIAIGSLNLMKSSKNKTQKLLEELKKY